MTGSPDLFFILRTYSNKTNSPSVSYIDFSNYVQKYARHYLEENPDLIVWLNDSTNVIQKSLDALSAEGKIAISTDSKGNKHILVPQYFVDRFSKRYKDIEERIEVPYPLASELPPQFPEPLIKSIYLTDEFTSLLEQDERDKTILYKLQFPEEYPALLYPGSLSSSRLLSLSLAKIRYFLRKDESRDYIQKRIMVASPGKEITIKNYFAQFQTRPTESLHSFKQSGEAFLFWSYFCSFIKQDFSKKSEKTTEDIALLQSVSIVEYLNNYYKTKIQHELQKETALKNLDLAFQKPPYFFNMDAITRFIDSRGIPLLGQDKDQDLQDYIKIQTSESSPQSLPHLLVFKSLTGERFFVLKDKIYPLIIRLCNEARDTIKNAIIKEWKDLLTRFYNEEAMSNQTAFEKKIELFCKTTSPILYAVLNAPFIPLLAIENSDLGAKEASGFTIFNHGRLLSWSDLLMLNRQELLTDARILLPFWYSIPIISAFIAFLKKPKKRKPNKVNMVKKIVSSETEENNHSTSTTSQTESRKEELKNAAKQIEKKLVPEGLSLQKELINQLDKWNINLDARAKQDLTTDVNALIKDYMRKIVRTIKATNFTQDRLENLATTLVDTPSLAKIKNRDALLTYTQLYMLTLIKNIK